MIIVVGLTAVAITCDVSDEMTRSRMLPRSWVEPLTCCTKPVDNDHAHGTADADVTQNNATCLTRMGVNIGM